MEDVCVKPASPMAIQFGCPIWNDIFEKFVFTILEYSVFTIIKCQTKIPSIENMRQWFFFFYFSIEVAAFDCVQHLIHHICNHTFQTNCVHFSGLFFQFHCIANSRGKGFKRQMGNNGFACNLCGKVYSSNNGSISRHKRFYCPFTEKSPLIYCYVCPFTSRRPDNFRTHMRKKHHILQ